MKKALSSLVVLVSLLMTAQCLAFSSRANNSVQASGELVNGYRIVSVDGQSKANRIVVFRGDYIKFRVGAGMVQPVLTVPSLGIEEALTADLETAPYFKMKKTGSFLFTIGEASGLLEVVEYTQANYRVVTAKEAQALIRNVKPVILDVRTPGEYAEGHIEGAILIPVQELSRRIGELSRYKNEDILIYCASGNRSTVAAKMLIDQGFRRVMNMRHGILQWAREKYPVVRP
jgi:rhodanese-related sulfurtransferase